MQFGLNVLTLEITENGPAVSVVAKVLQSIENIIFNFLSGSTETELSVYSVNLNVTGKCTDLYIVSHDVLELDFTLQQYITLPTNDTVELLLKNQP